MSEALRLLSEVDRVVVYEDRADVVRVAEVRLDAGGHRLLLEGLPALIDPARLRVTGRGLRIDVDDVRLTWRWLDDDTDAARRRLSAREQLLDERAALEKLEAELRQAEGERARLEGLLARYAQELSEALWSGEVPEGTLTDGDDGRPRDEGFATLEQRLRQQDKKLAVLRGQLAHQRRAVADLGTTPSPAARRLVADVEVRVQAPEGGAGLLEVGYVVPCALWRPSHQAELKGGKAVQWTTFATLWQRTGEDWEDAEVTLSTARPSAGASLPGLEADRLRLRTKSWEERRKVVIEHREESIPTRDLGRAAPGVYDGGEARSLQPSGRLRVPSDGKPHRVAIAHFESPAEARLIAIPELDDHVFFEATLDNPSSEPLLAGPVTLLVDGGHVGTGDLPYVGPGDRFELSFGSDDRFRLKHKRRRLEQDRKLGRDRTHFLSEVEVRSLADEKETVEIRLRLPVSEVEQLRVVPSEEHCTHGFPRPDEHGVVRLLLELSPGARAEACLGFYFDTSGDVRVPDPW